METTAINNTAERLAIIVENAISMLVENYYNSNELLEELGTTSEELSSLGVDLTVL